MDLKELKKLIRICREGGVEAIKTSEVELHLGPTPVINKVTKQVLSETAEEALKVPVYSPGAPPDAKIAVDDTWDSLTDEQKLFYSAQGPVDAQ
jgi:hypothetical protein